MLKTCLILKSALIYFILESTLIYITFKSASIYLIPKSSTFSFMIKFMINLTLLRGLGTSYVRDQSTSHVINYQIYSLLLMDIGA